MPRPNEPGVFLFEHAGFGGAMLHLTQSSPLLFLTSFASKVSSWAVNGDFSATLFDGAFFTGRRSSLASGEACEDLSISYSWGALGVRGCMGEVRNDTAASVGVGTAAVNPYDSPFYWPRGIWSNADSVARLTWLFRADHTYYHRTVAPYSNTAFTIEGSWFSHEFNPLVPTQGSRIATMSNMISWSNGAVTPYPDQDYPYRWQPGKKAIDIRMGSLTYRFLFVPQ